MWVRGSDASEGRNNITWYMDRVRADALRLLTVIDETQAHGHIGTTVIPSDAADAADLASVDFDPGNPLMNRYVGERYEAALRYLMEEEALIAPLDALDRWRQKSWDPQVYGIEFEYTERAQEMLREG